MLSLRDRVKVLTEIQTEIQNLAGYHYPLWRANASIGWACWSRCRVTKRKGLSITHKLARLRSITINDGTINHQHRWNDSINDGTIDGH
jgi:hypothetical protein